MRKVLAVTGTRSDYGLMRPVYGAIAAQADLELHLMVTGMHLLPEFATAMQEVRRDAFGAIYEVSMLERGDSGAQRAQALGRAVIGASSVMRQVTPDWVLLQGDRSEMLATAIAAAHMQIPIIHMSGGDYSGALDDCLRNAISVFAHLHLTTCAPSSERLEARGESPGRIWEAGEPVLDVIRLMKFIPKEELAKELQLDLSKPVTVLAQHPVTTEAEQAATQMSTIISALATLGLQTVATYANGDDGGEAINKVLESYRGQSWLRIVPNLDIQRFLSLLNIASVMVGNSSSGILEAPSFRLPVVNIGTRQQGRLRACNVIDVGYGKQDILDAIGRALNDQNFRAELKHCINPYGDGHTAIRVVALLQSLKSSEALLAKWMDEGQDFLKKLKTQKF